jgi:hypothetical protein
MVIVDVELRFVERMVPAADPQDARYVPRKILQSRKLVRRYQVGAWGPNEQPPMSPPEWTEWQDVPLVKE